MSSPPSPHAFLEYLKSGMYTNFGVNCSKLPTLAQINITSHELKTFLKRMVGGVGGWRVTSLLNVVCKCLGTELITKFEINGSKCAKWTLDHDIICDLKSDLERKWRDPSFQLNARIFPDWRESNPGLVVWNWTKLWLYLHVWNPTWRGRNVSRFQLLFMHVLSGLRAPNWF